MTTDATPDLETRLQQWLSESMTAWKRDNQWLLTHSDEAASLLKHQQAELTACRAEQARLQADIEKFWFHVEHAYDIEPRAYFEKEARTNGFGSPLAQAAHHIWKRDPKVAEWAAQVSTLTAELDMANEAATRWRTQLASTMASGPYVAPDGSVPTFAGVVPNLASERDTLTAALRRYGMHYGDCNMRPEVLGTSQKRTCTCGLDAVLRAASEGA